MKKGDLVKVKEEFAQTYYYTEMYGIIIYPRDEFGDVVVCWTDGQTEVIQFFEVEVINENW
tara:strand:+ start:187 stop:369 length:183 start_codon:yes stop_codon:yes gene_type:complete